MTVLSLAESIKQAAIAQGFDVVGISRLTIQDCEPFPQQPDTTPLPAKSLLKHLHDWMAFGYHGTMQWMGKEPERRADPRKVLPDCQSIISVGINYWTDKDPDEGPGNGRIARYAWGKDYHRLFKKRLKNLELSIAKLAPDATTRSYADTGPVMEKVWAQRAGLGWIGKHSNLVSSDFGSWLLLGEVLTNLELAPDEPGTDLCGTCTLCLQACPTNAITEPYIVDATKCISYLTIEYREDLETIPPALRTKMGNRIFGCDDCLDVCPYNVNALPTTDTAFFPSPITQSPNLGLLSHMNEDTFAHTFEGTPIRRPKHAGFQRNVQVAMANDITLSKSPNAAQQS
ncbi:MAG: tRNA epoxyqueuosine(34) reductase QueG [Nitrospirae bacterium]|nr:tRNA epoxyqueuosine(34) reductase QueG [Nitrospirota bacterium]MDA1304513.1 tRNA epoxyqueuosine(34) reductase QueG [Nitrospirota bacterium]